MCELGHASRKFICAFELAAAILSADALSDWTRASMRHTCRGCGCDRDRVVPTSGEDAPIQVVWIDHERV